MQLTNIFTSTLVLVGSALVQGQADYYGGSGYGAGSQTMSTSMMATSTAAADSMSTSMSSMMSDSSATSSAMSSTMSGTADSSSTKVHTVKVSNVKGDLVFSPADIKAAKGEMVQFQFYPKNHSVVQSTFDSPCLPIANTMPNVEGFFSGFMPVSKNSTMMPLYTIMVNDTKPIWFYCSQGKHCQAGMVGVINAPATNASRTLESYKALAAKAPANVSPSQVGGGSSDSGSSMSSTATTLMSSMSSSATDMPSGVASSTGSVRVSGTGSGTPAAVTGANAGGSFRLDGRREIIGSATAAGLLALAMGLWM